MRIHAWFRAALTNDWLFKSHKVNKRREPRFRVSEEVTPSLLINLI